MKACLDVFCPSGNWIEEVVVAAVVYVAVVVAAAVGSVAAVVVAATPVVVVAVPAVFVLNSFHLRLGFNKHGYAVSPLLTQRHW